MMNNLKKMIAVVIAFTMLSGAFLIMIPDNGQSSQVNSEPYADQIPIYADEEIRTRSMNDLVDMGLELSAEAPMVDNIDVNTTTLFWTQNTYYGDFYQESMTKRGEGEHCEVWVADNLNFSSPSDSRNFKVAITEDQVTYIMDEFDNGIYPVMTETFIEAPAINGTEPDISNWQYVYDDDNLTVEDIADLLFPTNDTGKMMIMIFNIRDYSFYDPGYEGGYVAGFYWGFIRNMYDRNVMHIDCYDWENRTGVQSDIPGSGHYSYVYESTVAHEYQHLLHAEQDDAEESWINEGLSMMSEYLCGYPLSTSHMAWFMATPDNSLTVWGDQGDINILADYGVVLMFMLYVYDHYGGTAMLQEIFTSPLQGIDSVNEALRDMGYNRMSFDKVFRNWRLANLLWTDEIGAGLYNYDSITWEDIGEELKILSYDADWGMGTGSEFGPTYTYRDSNTGVYMLDAYGTDYVRLYDIGGMDALFSKLVFDGDDEARIGWMYDSYSTEWYPTEVDMADYLLTMNVNLTQPAEEEGALMHWMNLTTWWCVEPGYDYCFIQVSTDDGLTWTSLNDTGDYCTEDAAGDAMEEIVENLPGLNFWPGTWSYVDVSFDLSAYDDQEIMVGFRYMTDWGFTYDYGGWFIDEVAIDGEYVDMETLNTVKPETDFILTIYAPGNEDVGPMIMNIPVNDLAETAQRLMGAFMLHDEIIILISPTEGPVDYEFGEISRGGYYL